MSWPYGTMTDEQRAQQLREIAQEQDPQIQRLMQKMADNDTAKRSAPGVAIILPYDVEPRWLELGVGIEDAEKKIAAVLGYTGWKRTALFRDRGDGENYTGFLDLYLLHKDGNETRNAAAASLHGYSLNLRRGTPILGDAVLVSMHTPKLGVWDEKIHRYGDISQRDKHQIDDFGRYVRGAAQWWPKEDR